MNDAKNFPDKVPESVKVLLIEDNPGDARLIREMLRDIKNSVFEIEHCDRLEGALSRLLLKGIDVVLTDLNLPDSEGIETFRRIYAKAPKLPIVVLTGFSDETMGIQTVQEGAQDYLIKQDVSSVLLARTIRYAIERNFAKLASEELVGTITHELRAPLTVIKEVISQVLEGLFGEINEQQRRIFLMSMESVARMARLINNLLDVYKMEGSKAELRKEKTDLGALIKEVVEGLTPKLWEKSLEINMSFPPLAVELSLDREKMVQAMTNLISNAIKFTEKGRIEITIAGQGGAGVEVTVSDTGIGIPSEELPKVFGKFEQLSNAAKVKEKGSGLGLYITKRIIELHGGRIWVESEFGKGTKFHFTIQK
ncbi:MAG TPA: hybrid sensor histidine kinase/response regulator [Candidatus Omnitrophota bacterium]|nr:hybrid sensor histidine kinase/response regulator [Candidatus Omnitrophota bacterium]